MKKLTQTQLQESAIRKIRKSILAESAKYTDDETTALIKLLRYAIDKRISEKITGMDYTRSNQLLRKLNANVG